MTTVDERTVWAWGANNCGQLGCGHREDLLAPTVLEMSAIAMGSTPDRSAHAQDGSSSSDDASPSAEDPRQLTVTQMTGGGAFSVLMTDSGRVLTCGRNDRGQLGQGARSSKDQDGQPRPDLLFFSPCSLTDTLTVTQVEAGWDFVLALTDSGSLLSWGSNSFGQLGRVLSPSLKWDHTPQAVSVPTSPACRFLTVAAGLRHALALSESGHIFSWGSGRRGQLGAVDPQGKPLPSSGVPVRSELSLAENDKPVQVAAGMNFSGVLTELGRTYIWGCNKFGQCGVPVTSENVVHLPKLLTFPDTPSKQDNGNTDFKIVSLAAGWSHMILRTESGGLHSLGRADLGQLGRDTDLVPQHQPGHISTVGNVTSHCCSSEHNLALTDKGQVFSWGWNEHGICGTGDETNVFRPELISQLMDNTVVSIGCGAGHCFCWTGKRTQSSKSNDCDIR